MKFYKIINDDAFIGVVTSNDMRRFQKKHRIILSCNESGAQYVQYGDDLYHDSWMLPVDNNYLSYVKCLVVEIDEREYDILIDPSKVVDEIIIDEVVDTPDFDDTNKQEEVTLEYVRNRKISEMSEICNRSIMSGFDMDFGDGTVHHFSMTMQDQVNMLSLVNSVNNGDASILYHADGESYKYFSADDFMKIVSKANEHKIYHMTYFNSLKAYILSLNDMAKIDSIQYGCNIPKKYRFVIE